MYKKISDANCFTKIAGRRPAKQKHTKHMARSYYSDSDTVKFSKVSSHLVIFKLNSQFPYLFGSTIFLLLKEIFQTTLSFLA